MIRPGRHTVLMAAALMAAAMKGVTEIGFAGAQTFESIRAAGQLSPSRIKRLTKPWSRSCRKGEQTRRTKHNRKKPLRSWRRARVLKLRGRR